jgi:hypothetical protein
MFVLIHFFFNFLQYFFKYHIADFNVYFHNLYFVTAALPPSDFMHFATTVKDPESSELSKIASIEGCLEHRPELLKLLQQSGFYGAQPEHPLHAP